MGKSPISIDDVQFGGGGLVAKSYLTLATPWTVAFQNPLSMGFSRQEYLSGLPFPSPGDLPNSGIKPRSPALQADSLSTEPPGKPSKCLNAGKEKEGKCRKNSNGGLPFHLIQGESAQLFLCNAQRC